MSRSRTSIGPPPEWAAQLGMPVSRFPRRKLRLRGAMSQAACKSVQPRRRLANSPKWRMRTKPFGQNVNEKTSQKLIGGDRHDFLLTAVRIVFPEKRDPIILKRNQSMVGDGDAVRIASEIVQNMLGTAEGWFGIDDPVLVEELSEKLAKAKWLSKTLE